MIFAIHQRESAIGMHMSPSSWMPLPPLSPSHPSSKQHFLMVVIVLILYVMKQVQRAYPPPGHTASKQ